MEIRGGDGNIQQLHFFLTALLTIVFTVSSVSKLKSFDVFSKTIQTLNIFPFLHPKVIALFVLLLEICLIFTFVFLPKLSFLSFFVSAILLSLYFLVLYRAVKVRLRANCNCFGLSDSVTGTAHLYRNGILIALSLSGSFLSTFVVSPVLTLDFINLNLIVMAGFASVVIVRFDQLSTIIS